jgi:hypothetical protein
MVSPEGSRGEASHGARRELRRRGKKQSQKIEEGK